MEKWLDKIILESELVKLQPLKKSYRTALFNAAEDGKLWELKYTSVPSKDSVESYINSALQHSEAGNALPFVVIFKSTNTIIGSTRYCNAAPEYKRLEIGYTWYSKSYQRTAVNTHCKFLLLRHAFEELNCICVQFKTHLKNVASRRAIERLGAKQDGILRNDRIMNDGSYRDTVVYSIIEEEWPYIKKELESKMKADF